MPRNPAAESLQAMEPPALTDYPFAAIARLIQTERAHSYFIRRSASNHPNIFVELRKVHDRWSKRAS